MTSRYAYRSVKKTTVRAGGVDMENGICYDEIANQIQQKWKENLIKMKKDLKSTTMKTIKGVLDGMLKSEANSTSCMFVYQPKAPEELKKFRKHK